MTLTFAKTEAQRRANELDQPYVVFHNAIFGEPNGYMVMPEASFDNQHRYRPQMLVDAILNKNSK